MKQSETLHVSKTISAKLEIADSAPINDSLLLLQGIGSRFNIFTPFIVLNGDCTESCPFLNNADDDRSADEVECDRDALA